MNRSLGRFSLLSAMSLCPLCWWLEPREMETFGLRAYRSYWKTKNPYYSVLMNFWFNKILFFWSLQTSLLCIVSDLAGIQSVAVGISDMWQVKCNPWHISCGTWSFVTVLLSAHVKRITVSHKRDFVLVAGHHQNSRSRITQPPGNFIAVEVAESFGQVTVDR